MPRQLKYVAQDAMDLFYATYKTDIEFFDIEDFITHTGHTVADIYQKYYELQYKTLRQDGRQEVVTFDNSVLSEQILDVKDESGILSAKLSQPIMSFIYDQSTVGIQDVFIIEPSPMVQVERNTVSSIWHLNYLPPMNKIWFYLTMDKLNFINKGTCNIKKVRVFYVPAMYDLALIPDGIINQAIELTVGKMIKLTDKKVFKESLNQNNNKILESEIDKQTLKP